MTTGYADTPMQCFKIIGIMRTPPRNETGFRIAFRINCSILLRCDTARQDYKNMKLIIIFIGLLPSMILFGQSKDENNFVFESNLPDDLHQHYDEANVRTAYAIRTDLNPFYLRGDFDGDKKQDYALAIVEKKSKKKGILIYHPATKIHYIIAAGNMTGNRLGDDFKWMDAWKEGLRTS